MLINKRKFKPAFEAFLKASRYEPFEYFWIILDPPNKQREYYWSFLDSAHNLIVQKADTIDKDSTRKLVGQAYSNGYEYIQNLARFGYTVTYIPANIGFTAKYLTNFFVGSRFVVVETDNKPLEDQWDEVIRINELTGLKPCTVTYSGGKSLHVSYRFNSYLTAEQLLYAKAYLTSIVHSDTALMNANREMRIAGFTRVKDGEERHQELWYDSDEAYEFDEFIEKLSLAWPHKYPFDMERFSLYKKQRSKKYQGEIDAFDVEMQEPEIKATERVIPKGFISSAENILDFYNSLSLQVPLEQIFCRYPHNFKQKGRDKVVGCSQYSPNNASGSAFQVNLKDYAWFCHSEQVGGYPYHYFAYDMYGKTKGLTGEQFFTVLRAWANALGRDLDTDLKEFSSKTYPQRKVTVEEKKLLTEEVKTENFSPLVGELKDTVIFYAGKREKAERYSQYLELPVLHGLNVGGLIDQIDNRVLTAKVIVEPGDLQSRLKMAWCESLQISLIEAGVAKVEFLWHGQFNEKCNELFDVELKKIKPISYEKLCKYEHSAKQIVVRKEQLAELEDLSLDPIQKGSWRFLQGNAQDAKEGIVTIYNSAMGTGKTHAMVEQLRNTETFALVGHRNGLLRQTANKVGARFLNDEKDIKLNENFAFCVDSILKLPINYWTGRTIVMDEVEAVISHTLIGSTVKKYRGNILSRLIAAINQACKTGGKVIAMEADITDITIQFFSNLCKQNIELVQNEYNPSSWNVRLIKGESKKAFPLIMDAIENGEKIAVAADSNEQATILGRIINRKFPDIKTLYVNQQTSSQEDVRAFLTNPDRYLEQNHIQVLIYTPTFESGGDISCYKFDQMFGLFTFLSTRSQLQLLGRVRTETVRTVTCMESLLQDNNESQFDWQKRVEQKRNNFLDPDNDEIQTAKELGEGCDIDKILRIKNDEEAIENRTVVLSSKINCRDNLYRKDAYGNLKRKLERYHKVVEMDAETDAELKEMAKEEQLKREQEDNEAWQAASADMSAEQADKILSSQTASAEEALSAIKSNQLRPLQGLEVDPEMSLELFVKKDAAYKKIYFHHLMRNIELAKKRETKEREHQTKQDIIIFGDLKPVGQQAKLLKKLKFFEHLDAGTWSKESLGEFHKLAKANQERIDSLFGLKVTVEPTRIFNALVRRMGMNILPGKEKTLKTYSIKRDNLLHYTNLIFDCLDVHYGTESTFKQLGLDLDIKNEAKIAETLTRQDIQCEANPCNNIKTATPSHEAKESAASLPEWLKPPVSSERLSVGLWKEYTHKSKRVQLSRLLYDMLDETSKDRVHQIVMILELNLTNKAVIQSLDTQYNWAERQIAFHILSKEQRAVIQNTLAGKVYEPEKVLA